MLMTSSIFTGFPRRSFTNITCWSVNKCWTRFSYEVVFRNQIVLCFNNVIYTQRKDVDIGVKMTLLTKTKVIMHILESNIVKSQQMFKLLSISHNAQFRCMDSRTHSKWADVHDVTAQYVEHVQYVPSLSRF